MPSFNLVLTMPGGPRRWHAIAFSRPLSTLGDDKTAYERRYGPGFSGPLIPFGPEITYLPITEKDKARLHQFGSKVLSGIFLGYEQQEGGGWSGDLLVLDWEEIENAEHSNIPH